MAPSDDLENQMRAAAAATIVESDGMTGKNTSSATTPYVAMELSNLPPAHEIGNGDGGKGNGADDNDGQQSMAPSIVSSVLTADGIHDVPGFLVVCLVILIGDMSRGVFFPTMWSLVSKLGGTEVTLGYAVGSFSFGRILVNPIFGSWSVSLGYTKTLLISCTILFFGTLLYTQIQNVGRPEFLIVAQTALGIGSGTLGVTRAFVADVTAKRTRTTYMAWITAVQYAGFTVTPFIGAIFVQAMQDTDIRIGILRLNKYTAPAYFMSGVTLVTLGLILMFFQNRFRENLVKPKKKSKRQQDVDEVANSVVVFGLSVYDCCIIGCMLLNVSTKGSIACFETLGIAFAESHFFLYSAKAGAIVATCGTLGVFCLLGMGVLTQIFTDIQLIVGGMLIMGSGIASLSVFKEGIKNPTWRYILAIFLIYSIGYPIGHTAVIGLFSKIVGRRAQGALQGWFASAGSAARILFPLISGYIAHYSEITTLFFLLTTVLFFSTIFVLFGRKTLMLLSS